MILISFLHPGKEPTSWKNLREPDPSLGSCTLAKRPTIASGLNLTAWYLSAPGNMLNKYITMSGSTGAGGGGGGG